MPQGSSSAKPPRSGTKERILEAAFSFYGGIVFENVSLSKIAAKVGISKPAIFKHFRTKNALREAMDEQVFSRLAILLKDAEAMFRGDRGGEALALVIRHLAVNREETFYLISTLPRVTADAVFMQLRRRGVNLFDDIFAPDGSVKDADRYYLTVLAGSTFLCFLMFWFASAGAGEAAGGSPAASDGDDGGLSAFIGKFNVLIQEGLPGLGGISAPQALDERCAECVAAAPPLNRAFAALAAVIERKGVRGVTVEAIAAELGLAKSSLYSSYRSKEDLVRKLVDEELASLYGAALAAVAPLAGCGDRVYALLRVSMLYFIARPEMLVIFQSVVLSGGGRPGAKDLGLGCRDGDRCRKPLEGLLALRLLPALPDVGIRGFDRKMLLSWFFALPTMLYLHSRVHGCGADQMLGAVTKSHLFLRCGINGWRAGESPVLELKGCPCGEDGAGNIEEEAAGCM